MVEHLQGTWHAKWVVRKGDILPIANGGGRKVLDHSEAADRTRIRRPHLLRPLFPEPRRKPKMIQSNAIAVTWQKAPGDC